MRAVIIHPDAHLEIARISEWYDSRRSNYGTAFESEFDICLNRIAEHPLTYAFALEELQVRRALMPNFLFHIYFSEESNQIKVWTVVHSHRSPRVWKLRVRRRHKE